MARGMIVKEVTQITVVIPHVPGSLARITEALRDADVNIEGTCQQEGSDTSMPLRLVIDKPIDAKKAIEALGQTAEFEPCISVQAGDDKPGFIARIARALGDAKINIQTIYHASAGRGSAARMFISVDKSHYGHALKVLSAL